jgi:hypothetical protein
MFVGHFGVGLGLKRIVPSVSLGTLFLAAQFIDLLWPSLLLVGLEHVEIVPGITRVTPLDFVNYPISHSLLAVIGWAVLFALAYLLIRKHRLGAVICGIAVLSHWLLDLVTHRPDLPLYPGSASLVGFGLWNSLWATLVIELLMFGGGAWLYFRSTSARDRTGSIGLWALLGFLLLVYLGNILGPPPESPIAIAWLGHAQWLLIAWGYWVDRHRRGLSDELDVKS